MALLFQGLSKADIETGIITKVEMAYQSGTPSYVDVGDFERCDISVNTLTMPSDPSNSDLPYAMEFDVSFAIVQTGASTEIGAMTSATGTGALLQAVQLRITYITGRVLTLGAVTAYPMLVNMNYTNGGADGAQKIECTGHTIEPLTAFPGKVS